MCETELLWNEFFTDPAKFGDNRLVKRSPSSSDFRSKQTGKALWVEGWNSPPYIKNKRRTMNSCVVANDYDLDRTTLLNLIKECGKEKNLWKARRIHEDVVKKEWIPKDVHVATALITTYAKCNELSNAREVFQQIQSRDVVSWNALISGYVQHGLAHKAIECFEQMQDEEIQPDPITFTCILKACGMVGFLHIGEDIDSKIRKQGLLERDVVLGTALVDMYSKCGAFEKARDAFEHLPARNVVSWTALISGYTQHGHGEEALKCFRQMQDTGVYPNAITYISILKACGMTRSLEIGEEIDVEVRKQGLFLKNIVLGNSLVAMYAKCGALEKAREVFEHILPKRDVVSWNVLIDGYAQHGFGDEALKLFRRMQDVGVYPDVITFVCILKTCSILGLLEIGKDIDAEIRKRGLLQKNVVLGTALVDMYSKCGALEKAQEVFEEIPKWDVVSWNALITAYVQNGLADQALECLRKMEDVGVCPNAVTYICVLKACGIIGSLEIGEDIDAESRRRGLLHKDVVLGTAIVDMYSKCGDLEKALEVFKLLPIRNVVSWTALISGYAQVGQANVVKNLYTKMRREAIVPNSVTFIVLLTACSHAGEVEAAEKLFDEMCAVYHLTPTLGHYACMIDIFGRAGHFDKAKALLDKVPFSDRLPLFLGILGACHKWRNVNIGRWAFEQSLELDLQCSVAYICMENIYIAAGMQQEAGRIEALRLKNRAWKRPGCCWWTDASTRKVHSFPVADQNHPQNMHIYKKLEEIHRKLLQAGYSPSLHWVSQPISENKGKDDVLCGCSEKLAIACALVNTPKGVPIRITKNIRICDDCHSSISLISTIEERWIQVSDGNRVHIFEHGRCICDD